ncbi:hypothetical protein Q73_13140 [Bacillus coahuilensis m2-6]|uniref:VanZ-like domain-containing protein n=1 Tax=Bacillus coahuilensis p1.1.43 TaxID=1150625 RepID=A0A147K4P7_9BACI|nr:VanZ family protein [Bacillus coahuilensis]KUP04401.1 hypothetical protein Q75_15505 [Bacillus coahuilensis p1.1.43]KUP05472.1 hypothetical protein Q73_13140 [Bacillus coahuilensis m2-6]
MTKIPSLQDAHDSILKLADQTTPLTDKELHFLIFGVIGLVFYIITKHILYFLVGSRTTILSVCLSLCLFFLFSVFVEFYQELTKSGSLEWEDLMCNTAGFMVYVGVYSLVGSWTRIFHKSHSLSV